MERYMVLPSLPGSDLEHRPGHPGSHPGSRLQIAVSRNTSCPSPAQQPDRVRGACGHCGFSSLARRGRQGPGPIHQGRSKQSPWTQRHRQL
eukprot:1914050-Pyramimonas_sp.AAC.1